MLNTCGWFRRFFDVVITVRNNSCGKVMFSQVSVSHSVHWESRYFWAQVLSRSRNIWSQVPFGDRYLWSQVPLRGYVSLVPGPFQGEVRYSSRVGIREEGIPTPLQITTRPNCYWHLVTANKTGTIGILLECFVEVVLFSSFRCLLRRRVRADVTVCRRIRRHHQHGEQSDQVQSPTGLPQNGSHPFSGAST